MIFGKTLTTLAAAAAIAAAAGGSVNAAALALLALREPHQGAAGGAAILVLLALATSGIAGLLAARKAEVKPSHAAPDGFAFAERAIEMVKDRPILTIGAGLAAGIIALRNPALAAIVAKALLDSQKPPR